MVENTSTNPILPAIRECLANQFVEQVKGMTNDEIVDYLADKPAHYVDNTCLDHSGEFFDPVKFFFMDGSIIYIFDWSEERPVMKVYEPVLTHRELIGSFNEETGDFDHFCAELIATLHALAITDYPEHELTVTRTIPVAQGLEVLLSTPTFRYTLVLPDDDHKPDLSKCIAQVIRIYQPYDPSDGTGVSRLPA